MSDERIPRRDWRETGRRVTRAAIAGFLLACSAGLFYVGVLAWYAGPRGASGPKGLPIVGLAALTAIGATVFMKSALLPSAWPDEEQF